MCFPRWHCDAVFSTLIGGHGRYAITPTDTFVWGGHYESGTLIWRSRWVTPRSALPEQATDSLGDTPRVRVAAADSG